MLETSKKSGLGNKAFALIASMVLFVYNAMADDGPSLKNVHKNLDVAKEEFSRQEIINYIFMIVGFLIVLSVAWFSTSLAKKRKLERDEFIRAHHHNQHIKHNPHDPYFKRTRQ